MKRGDYELACEAFEQSIAIRPSVGAFLNLALSEEQLGRLANALEHFECVVSMIDAKDERQAFALTKIRELTARASNQEMASQPAPHQDLPPPATPPATTSDRTVPPAAPVASAPRAAATSGWAFVLAGAGVTALAVSAATGVAAVDRRNNALDHCQGKFCDPQGLAAADGARWYAGVSTGALIGGLLGVGAASYFFLRRGSATTNQMAVGVASVPGQTQLIVRGSL